MKDSIVKIKNLIQYANDLGNPGVVLTDHGTVSGFIEMINTFNKLKKNNKINKDFKIGLGNEIYLNSREEIKEKREKNEKIDFYHFILIAKDLKGNEQLRQLNSRAWKDNYMVYRNMRRVPNYYSDLEEVIGDDKGHLIATSACLGSLVGNLSEQLLALSKEDRDTADEEYEIKSKIAEYIEWCLDLFGDDFYLEMQPNNSEEQVFYNQLLNRLSKAYNIKLSIATDVHYLDNSYKATHEAFLTSDEDNNSNREVGYFYDTTHFFKVEEIYESLSQQMDEDIITQAILNTKGIMDKIELYDWFADPTIPLTPLPNEDEWYKVNEAEIINYPSIYTMWKGRFKYNKYFIHKVLEGLEYRNITTLERPMYLDRINTECFEILGISEKLNNPVGGYLTTMQVIVDLLWENSIIPPGRGSAVCYVSNYLLGITQVDPLKVNKLGVIMKHWRFLSADRPGMPKQYWALSVNPAKGCII